jgi:hypothetical protein
VQIRNPNIEIRNKFDGEIGQGKNAGEKTPNKAGAEGGKLVDGMGVDG